MNAQDANGRTPLLWAARLGYHNEVHLLVKHGAQLDSVDLQGSTALAKAVEFGDLECVRYLLEDGVFLEIAKRPGTLPLHVTAACQRHGVQLMRSLFNLGADVNARSACGVTLLYHAAFQGGLTNVKYLLSRGANRDATNAIGQTPTGKAPSCQQFDVFCYLVRKGAQLGVEATNGHQTLYTVASSGSRECLDVLDEAAREGRLKTSLSSLEMTAMTCGTASERVGMRNWAPTKWMYSTLSPHFWRPTERVKASKSRLG